MESVSTMSGASDLEREMIFESLNRLDELEELVSKLEKRIKDLETKRRRKKTP